jgi:hypothetical protein
MAEVAMKHLNVEYFDALDSQGLYNKYEGCNK